LPLRTTHLSLSALAHWFYERFADGWATGFRARRSRYGFGRRAAERVFCSITRYGHFRHAIISALFAFVLAFSPRGTGAGCCGRRRLRTGRFAHFVGKALRSWFIRTRLGAYRATRDAVYFCVTALHYHAARTSATYCV